MAYSVREERQGLATSLREDLAQAERGIVQLRRDNVAAFLRLLDGIEENFVRLESSGLDLRPEQTRWGSLLSKLMREAGRVYRAVELAGGYARLRQENAPAEGLWWHLDAVVAKARRRLALRVSTTVGAVVVILGVIWALITFVFPPDADTVLASETISTMQQLAFEGRWEEALAAIEEAKAQFTRPDAEVLIWEAVLRQQLGQAELAPALLEEAKALVPAGQEVAYWWTLGSTLYTVGDLEGARAAGDEAVALDSGDPQGYFLLGTVAEAEGDTSGAIDLFETTYQMAADGNPQLAVIARVRMGHLLQRPANMPLYGDEAAAGDGESGVQGQE